MTAYVSRLLFFVGNCVILLAASHDTHSATTTGIVRWVLAFPGDSLALLHRFS